jgi:ribosome-binding factor A
MSNLVSEVLNDDKRKQEESGRTDETQSKDEE